MPLLGYNSRPTRGDEGEGKVDGHTDYVVNGEHAMWRCVVAAVCSVDLQERVGN